MHELIQSEIQSDIIREKSLSLPAEVFRFRSVKYTPPYKTINGSTTILMDHALPIPQPHQPDLLKVKALY